MAFLLGLTGNIACGKSSVGQLLAERYAADYIDADRLVHAQYAAGTPETRAIAERFGQHLLKPDGTIDRRQLGDIVMADPAALRDLEAILHPGVRRAINERIASSRAEVVVLDAIRLFEAGLADRCDAVWVVVCDPAAQVRRLMEQRGFTEEQARLRVEAQGSQDEKARRATVVLRNDGTLEDLARQVEQAWRQTVEAQRVQSRAP